MSNDKTGDTPLDKAYKAAQIFALIVMPIVVAAVGWMTQKSLTDANTSKDYVQMAVQVLREPRRPDDGDIRKWANEVIGKNSPVPFSSKAGEQLSSSALGMLRSHPLLKSAMEKREKCPSIDLKAIPQKQLQAVEKLQQLCNKNGTDLFWMKTYINLIAETSEETSGAKHAPVLSFERIPGIR